jgi:hypothetical protein
MPAVYLTTKVDPYPGIPECPVWTLLSHVACGSTGCVEPPGLIAEKQRLGPLGASFSGICGDSKHNYGFHRAPNQIPRSDYSLRGDRNRPVCRDHAAAIDIGMNWPASRAWLKWLIGEIRAGRITGVSEVIGSYGGRNKVMYWSWEETPSWPDVGIDYYRKKDGEGHYDWSHVAVFRSTTNDDQGILRGWTRNGQVRPDPPPAPPPPPGDVECFVFDDGYKNIAGPADAIFFRNPRAACVPDGGGGTCRKWFGRCRTKGAHVPVTFEAFEDGHRSVTKRSDAVYVRGAASACIPDGTSSGACRKWFGEPRTADGRAVSCRLFGDGYSSMTGATAALYFRASGSICQPDGTPRGSCRKWFGRCSAR